MLRAGFVLALLLVCVAACATREVLIPKSPIPPAGIDLSGQWLLRGAEGESRRAARETLVYAFFETGRSLKVTQTPSGLFISFDRSVVEEYRFGEQREISIGEIKADRVSGWDRNGYVIETLDADGAKLVERWGLDADGRVLRRRVRLTDGSKVELDLEQVFDRV
ncbi:MAG: hypothetical protein R3176_05745 [Woeseiaceae bacterium]|nr:hypothetical protein [Woeseiaceae bacterium]